MDFQQPLRHQQPPVTGVAQWGRIAFMATTGLFLVGIALQVFLAGMSIFVSPIWWSAHVMDAHIIELLPLLLIILAFVARFPRAVVLWSIGLLGLFALQYAFIEVAASTGVRWLAAFHPVNALAMFLVTLYLHRQARQALR